MAQLNLVSEIYVLPACTVYSKINDIVEARVDAAQSSAAHLPCKVWSTRGANTSSEVDEVLHVRGREEKRRFRSLISVEPEAAGAEKGEVEWVELVVVNV